MNYTRLSGRIIGAIFCLTLFIIPSVVFAAIEEDKSTAVIFLYQRIGEDNVPGSNISVEQLIEHIQELKKGGYNVLPLPKIIDTLKNGNELPPKSIGITIEGAYQTTISNALPLFEEAHMPFTVFFASDMPDSNNPTHLSWSQIKKLRKNKLVSLGILPASYEHMVNQTTEKKSALINKAVSRYREMLDEDPQLFSYPYGEYDATLKKQLTDYKFKAVFGQQSGGVYTKSDFMALPRFTMTDDYGDLDRFSLTANALPLPITDLLPEDTIITQNPPRIGFTISPDITNLSKLACFASSLGKLPLTRLGGNRIEIKLEQPLTDRRTRINCTLPNDVTLPGEPLNWRWMGMLLIIPTLDEETTGDSTTEELPEDQ